MAERFFSSKYAGKCYVCLKSFQSGASIGWERGVGARHSSCEKGAMIDKATGKTYAVLAEEWDIEHANDMCPVERYEAMLQEPCYRDVPEDAIMDYARQDTPRNPWR